MSLLCFGDDIKPQFTTNLWRIFLHILFKRNKNWDQQKKDAELQCAVLDLGPIKVLLSIWLFRSYVEMIQFFIYHNNYQQLPQRAFLLVKCNLTVTLCYCVYSTLCLHFASRIDFTVSLVSPFTFSPFCIIRRVWRRRQLLHSCRVCWTLHSAWKHSAQ